MVPEIFLGRLPKDVHPDHLKPILEAYGELVDLRFLREKNCGFATFRSYAEAEAALNGLQQSQALGENVNVKWANARGNPAAAKSSEGLVPEKKIFIGGMGGHVTEQDLYALASPFGNIVHAKLFRSNPNRPCGFVTFETFQEAESAIETLHESPSPLAAEGRTLVVKFAELKGEKVAKIPNQAFGMGGLPPTISPPSMMAPGMIAGGIPAGLAATGMTSAGMLAAANGWAGGNQSSDVWSQSTPNIEAGYKVFIGGLAGDVSEDYVRGLVALLGGVLQVKVLRKDTSLPCAFVVFNTPEIAQRCIDTMNDNENGGAPGRKLAVRWAEGRAESQARKRLASGEPPGAPPQQKLAGGVPGLTGTAPAPAPADGGRWLADGTEQAANPGDVPEKLFVGGLTQAVTDTDLGALFGTYGTVLSARALRGSKGPPYGLVQYSTQEEAAQAIAALNHYAAFSDKPLVVQFAKPKV